MQETLKEIEKKALGSLAEVQDEAALETWRITHLGRSSQLTQVFNSLGGLSHEERPKVGMQANEVKKALESAFTERSETLKRAVVALSLEQ